MSSLNVCLWTISMTGVCGGQKRLTDSPGSIVTNDWVTMWMWGIEPKSCVKTSAPSCWAISAALFLYFWECHACIKWSMIMTTLPFPLSSLCVSHIPPPTSYLVFFVFMYKLSNPVSAIWMVGLHWSMGTCQCHTLRKECHSSPAIIHWQ